MIAWNFLRELHQVCSFQSREKPRSGKASTSELKRWLQNGVLVINTEKVSWDEEIDFPIISVVLFPKHPVTLL